MIWSIICWWGPNHPQRAQWTHLSLSWPHFLHVCSNVSSSCYRLLLTAEHALSYYILTHLLHMHSKLVNVCWNYCTHQNWTPPSLGHNNALLRTCCNSLSIHNMCAISVTETNHRHFHWYHYLCAVNWTISLDNTIHVVNKTYTWCVTFMRWMCKFTTLVYQVLCRSLLCASTISLLPLSGMPLYSFTIRTRLPPNHCVL